MIIVGLAMLLLYIYLTYCIIDTHVVSLDNNTMLKKLLAIEKKKQSNAMVPQQPLPTIDVVIPSEQVKDISIFEDIDQD